MRRSLSSVFVVLASVLLGSCGGGGAASPGPIGGPPQIQPSVATFYAGVEYTMTVSGGRPPYTLSSSEPSLLAVPTVLNGNFFNVIPNNPGVIDTGLPPGSVPTRGVTITMRDSVGSTAATAAGGISVAANFMTGYGVRLSSNCTPPTTGAAPGACASGETLVELSATISGNLNGNRQYRFEVVRGPFYWVHPNGQIAGNTVTVFTDHEGEAEAIFRVNPNIGTQIGILRVVDVATGASMNHAFTINGVPLGGALEAIPDSFTFTGATTAQCGVGSADFLVFDGTPPYRAISSFPNIIITPEVSNEQPGRFRLTATNPLVCVSDATIIITDSTNSRTTVTVTTEAGSEDPPPPPLSLTPQGLTLSCGVGGSVSILGGGGTFSVSSADSRVAVTISGRTLTATRTATDPVGTPPSPTPGTPNPINFSVTVTDGTSVATLSVIAPSNCPP